MKFRSIAAAAAAFALTTSPVLAQVAVQTTDNKTQVTRAVDRSANESELDGDGSGLIIALLAAAAIIAGIVIAVDNDDDTPASP